MVILQRHYSCIIISDDAKVIEVDKDKERGVI